MEPIRFAPRRKPSPYKGLAGDSIYRDTTEKLVTFNAGTQPPYNFATNQGDTVWYAYGEQIPILSKDEMPYTRANKSQLLIQPSPD